jgi:hypothetical protein
MSIILCFFLLLPFPFSSWAPHFALILALVLVLVVVLMFGSDFGSQWLELRRVEGSVLTSSSYLGDASGELLVGD